MTPRPGVGPRAAAWVVDAIVGFVVIGIPLLVAFGTRSTTSTPAGSHATKYSLSDPKVLAVWLALALVYYVLFERLLGATPGKLVLGVRVRMSDGSRPTWRAATIRNLLRFVDALPYAIPYLAGAIAVWNDRDENRRLGDRVAGTIVTYR
jgi:uncharacterized RDD family membrane protein YckC